MAFKCHLMMIVSIILVVVDKYPSRDSVKGSPLGKPPDSIQCPRISSMLQLSGTISGYSSYVDSSASVEYVT